MFLAISPETRVFVKSGTIFESSIDINCRVTRTSDERVTVDTDWADTVRTQDYRMTRNRETRFISRFIPLEPGDYTVDIRVTDRNSGKSMTRSKKASILGAGGEESFVGEIQIRFRERSGRMVQLPGPSMPLESGMISGNAEIHNLQPADSVVAVVAVDRVERDMSIPRLPHLLGPVRGSLEYSGIRVEQRETIFLDTIAVLLSDDSAVRWDFSIDEEGLYLVRVTALVFQQGNSLPLGESTRPVIITSPEFPRPGRVNDLIESATYIMNESEIDSIGQISSAEGRHSWLQRFWRTLRKSEESAERGVERYYARVRDANEYFSTFKEGWRTDRGMLYIVLGPPLSIQQGLQVEIWNYSAVEGDQKNTYLFRKVNLPEEFGSFDHFLLDRQAFYDQQWLGGVERWRNGSDFW